MYFLKSKLFKRSRRVLILPVNTGGTIIFLREALKLLNYDAEILTFSKHPFGYKKNKIIFKKNTNFLNKEIRKVLALRFYFYSKYIIFNYGRTIFTIESFDDKKNFLLLRRVQNIYYFIMQKIEIFINKMLNNKIIFIYAGDDARQSKYCLENFNISPAHSLLGTSYYSEKKDKIKKFNIRNMDKIANSIYAHNPDIMNVLPKRTTFLPYPYRFISKAKKEYPVGKINILHVPSHRGVKGTEIIINQINNLKKNKPDLEINLTILENINNLKLLKKLGNFDLVIDQLLVGWYGSIAVESMARGIPVMAYIRESDLHFIPTQMQLDLPIINVSKDNLNKKIIEFSKLSKEEFMDLTSNSIAYVKKWHSIELCAEYLIDNFS